MSLRRLFDIEGLELVGRRFEREPSESKSLCYRCQNGLVMRRKTPKNVEEEPVVWCSKLSRRVPPDIVECTRFWDPKALSLTEMTDMALTIDARLGINDGSYR